MAAIPVNILPGATGESGVTAIGQLTVIPGTKNALQDLGDYLIFDKVRIYKRHANWGLDATVIPGPLQILTAVLGFKLGNDGGLHSPDPGLREYVFQDDVPLFCDRRHGQVQTVGTEFAGFQFSRVQFHDTGLLSST